MLKSKKNYSIDPDEIFLDSTNLPSFDDQQFEGRLEKPIARSSFYLLGATFLLIFLTFTIKTANLQLVKGEEFAMRSQNNTLRYIPLFAERGVIYDRNKIELAWNNPNREYSTTTGLSNLLGYISYPSQDDLKQASFNPKELIGKDGAEKLFDAELKGVVGTKIEEVDVQGEIRTDYILVEPLDGKEVLLSVDSRVQGELARLIKNLALDKGFGGGAGVILDIKSGELLAIVTYPEYDSQTLADGKDVKKIKDLLTNPSNPFLNRALFGLYTPGSIFKPIVAVGALSEGIINPEKKILSTGQLELPNPYFPDKPSIFKDWKAHGYVNMRDAIAVSSNVYFYHIGGGFEDQRGLGIKQIERYARLFGLGESMKVDGVETAKGVVPNPTWKAENFEDDQDWRVGDTYHTSIGQYGTQVTPLQIARAIGAIANGGVLVTPTLLKTERLNVSSAGGIKLPLKDENLKIVREGMRQGVEKGTATSLSVPFVQVAAKTGTAEIGLVKADVNSWVAGFFPYDDPHYAFAVVMEKGRRENLIGSPSIMRALLDWMNQNTPEYFNKEIDPEVNPR